MSIEVRAPVLPESISEATLVAWHKAAGETVRRDENLADLETDKVVLELPAPKDGVLSKQLIAAGTSIKGGELLAELEPAPAAETPAETAAETAAPAAAAPEPQINGKPEPADTNDAPDAEAFASPAIRRLMHEHGIQEQDLQGSGKHGRILREDVERAIAAEDSSPAAEPRPSSPAAPATRDSKRVPMTRMRRTIAERLVQVQQQTAMLTTFNEVDMSTIKALRAEHREAFEQTHGIRLGMMSFFIKAATEALRAFPILNASVDGDDIVYHGHYDIGIAVASPRGLVVPVVRGCDHLDFAGIEKQIRAYAAAAREGKLQYEDLQGGTFTITNGGVFGSLMSTPILNPPQSAILGMHSIAERPVVRDGQIVARPMMYLALSYDHRIVDGADAVQFLAQIKHGVEDPARILLEI